MSRRYRLATIARSGERFRDFRPYVASINAGGTVAFQARLVTGETAVFTGDGGAVGRVEHRAGLDVAEVISHPDVNSEGDLSFYARLVEGAQGLVVIDGQRLVSASIADSRGTLAELGPLGPTINDLGVVAFRATTRQGQAAILRYSASAGSSVETIADTSGEFVAFEGLPVINRVGAVAFRATLADGSEGVFLERQAQVRCVAHTHEGFSALGRFPCLNDAGSVGFVATLRSGGWGVFTVSDGECSSVIVSDGEFEDFRGVLLDARGQAVFYATPRGGKLGIYAGPDLVRDKILAVGDEFDGGDVMAFALNPVSINGAGQLAIRVELDQERQVILRADPSEPSLGDVAKRNVESRF